MDHYINEAIKFGCNIFVELIGVVLLIIGIIGLITSGADYVFCFDNALLEGTAYA